MDGQEERMVRIEVSHDVNPPNKHVDPHHSEPKELIDMCLMMRIM